MTTENTSVTAQIAEWVESATYESIPKVGIERVKERVIDSLAVQFAGMAVDTGEILTEWVRDIGAREESSVVASDLRTTAAFATLINATAGHTLEYDDTSVFSGHYANPVTAAALAVGEKVGASGEDVVLAWMTGYEVIAAVAKATNTPKGNSLLVNGFFNQGFYPVFGCAAIAGKLMGLDAWQIRMAFGNAATAMSGMMKNRGSHAKAFTAGNAAMHGVMAAELASRGLHCQRGHLRHRHRRRPPDEPRVRQRRGDAPGPRELAHGRARLQPASARLVHGRPLERRGPP